MEAYLPEQILAQNPWGFGARSGGGAGHPGNRTLWAEAIAAAGAGQGVQHATGFTAPAIRPGQEMPEVSQNPHITGGGQQVLSSAPSISGGSANPGSIGPGIQKLGEGLAAGLKAYQAKRLADAQQASQIQSLGGQPQNFTTGDAPQGLAPPIGGQATPPLMAQPGVSQQQSTGTGVSGKGGVGWWTPERQSHAIDYLKANAGLSDVGAAGMVSRWTFEAPKGPTDSNALGGGHYGIGQWGNARGGQAVSGMNFDQQLAKAAGELQGSESHAGDLLRNATDAASAARGASAFERAENWNPSTNTDILTARTQAAIPAALNLHPANLSAAAPAPIAPGSIGVTPGVTSGLPESGASSGISPTEMQSLDHYQDMQQDAGGQQSANPMPAFAQSPSAAPSFGNLNGGAQGIPALALALAQNNPDLLASLFSGGGGGLFG